MNTPLNRNVGSIIKQADEEFQINMYWCYKSMDFFNAVSISDLGVQAERYPFLAMTLILSMERISSKCMASSHFIKRERATSSKSPKWTSGSAKAEFKTKRRMV